MRIHLLVRKILLFSLAITSNSSDEDNDTKQFWSQVLFGLVTAVPSSALPWKLLEVVEQSSDTQWAIQK